MAKAPFFDYNILMGKSFAEIYAQWTHGHNEVEQIVRCGKSDDESNTKQLLTIGELRRMRIQDSLDLHGLLLDVAMKEADEFISSSVKRGLRKVRIVTGKGLHSPGGEAVIRPAIIAYLKASKAVREVDENPKPEDGGSGAVVVILK